MEWKDINGYPNHRIREDGLIYHTRTKRMIRGTEATQNKTGKYIQVRLDGKLLYAHRLVCEAWHGPCPKNKNCVFKCECFIKIKCKEILCIEVQQ